VDRVGEAGGARCRVRRVLRSAVGIGQSTDEADAASTTTRRVRGSRPVDGGGDVRRRFLVLLEVEPVSRRRLTPHRKHSVRDGPPEFSRWRRAGTLAALSLQSPGPPVVITGCPGPTVRSRRSRAAAVVGTLVVGFFCATLIHPPRVLAATERVLAVAADAHVSAARPRTNLGASKELRIDDSPSIRSYLSFELPHLDAPVGQALLRVYVKRGSRAGFRVRAVTDGWREKAITWANAPDVSVVRASARSVRGGRWTTVDVTSLVSAEGHVSFALTTPAASAIRLASGEAWRPPQLRIRPDAEPPLVMISSPPTGTTYTTAEEITITATASDNVRVRRVEFYDGARLVGTDRSRPYTYRWSITSAANGVHAWSARAYDAAGNSAVSAPTALYVRIGIPSTPTNFVTTGSTQSSISTSWTPSTDDVGVSAYRLYVNSTNVATTTATSHTFSGLSCGTSYALGVEAIDAAGNVSSRATLVASTSACPSADPVIAVAGDIAGAGTGDEATARLLDAIRPTRVLTTGDNAYPDGTRADFDAYYAPTWGRHKAVTRPTPGNHDYHTAGAAGYFGYFGSAAGDPAKGYYSFDVGAWHLIALNSEIAHDSASSQVTWLRSDLAASTAKCTLAYWHKPRFTAGGYSDMPQFTPFWQALYEANADVVVNGHDHNYQRYPSLNPAGAIDTARGILEFVVGTGGRSHYALRPDSRRLAGNDDTFGVLTMTLHATSFDWRFVPEAGKTYADSGSASCH
jgi:hypothetical protein